MRVTGLPHLKSSRSRAPNDSKAPPIEPIERVYGILRHASPRRRRRSRTQRQVCNSDQCESTMGRQSETDIPIRGSRKRDRSKGERIVYLLQKSDRPGDRGHDRGSGRLGQHRRRGLHVYRPMHRLYRRRYRHVDSSRRLRVGNAAFSRRPLQFQLQFEPDSGSIDSQ